MDLPDLQPSDILMPDAEHHASVSLEPEERGDEAERRGVPTGEEDSTKEGRVRTYFHLGTDRLI